MPRKNAAAPQMSAMLTPRPGNTGRPGLALLGSLCLFLSAVEYIIPKPLPFMRIGLANLPLLLALDIFGPADFFLLAAIKVLGQGILSGSLFSYVFLFSLAGTFSSAALMYGMRKLLGRKYCGFAGIGCAGAMTSNGVQLLLAGYLIFGASLRYLVPPFLASGFITGIALGVLCEIFCRSSRWYAMHIGARNGTAIPAVQAAGDSCSAPDMTSNGTAQNRWEERRIRRRERWHKMFNGPLIFAAGGVLAVTLIFSPSLPVCAAVFSVLCVLAWLSGTKTNATLTLLVMAGIVFFNLLAPHGKVLFELGAVRVTQGSLFAGLRKALTLEGLVLLSGACVKSDMRLPGKFGLLLADTFTLLEKMRERKNTIRRGRIIEGIDRLMLELEANGQGTRNNM